MGSRWTALVPTLMLVSSLLGCEGGLGGSEGEGYSTWEPTGAPSPPPGDFSPVGPDPVDDCPDPTSTVPGPIDPNGPDGPDGCPNGLVRTASGCTSPSSFRDEPQPSSCPPGFELQPDGSCVWPLWRAPTTPPPEQIDVHARGYSYQNGFYSRTLPSCAVPESVPGTRTESWSNAGTLSQCAGRGGVVGVSFGFNWFCGNCWTVTPFCGASDESYSNPGWIQCGNGERFTHDFTSGVRQYSCLCSSSCGGPTENAEDRVILYGAGRVEPTSRTFCVPDSGFR